MESHLTAKMGILENVNHRQQRMRFHAIYFLAPDGLPVIPLFESLAVLSCADDSRAPVGTFGVDNEFFKDHEIWSAQTHP
jgi:hypothetical protein